MPLVAPLLLGTSIASGVLGNLFGNKTVTDLNETLTIKNQNVAQGYLPGQEGVRTEITSNPVQRKVKTPFGHAMGMLSTFTGLGSQLVNPKATTGNLFGGGGDTGVPGAGTAGVPKSTGAAAQPSVDTMIDNLNQSMAAISGIGPIPQIGGGVSAIKSDTGELENIAEGAYSVRDELISLFDPKIQSLKKYNVVPGRVGIAGSNVGYDLMSGSNQQTEPEVISGRSNEVNFKYNPVLEDEEYIDDIPFNTSVPAPAPSGHVGTVFENPGITSGLVNTTSKTAIGREAQELNASDLYRPSTRFMPDTMTEQEFMNTPDYKKYKKQYSQSVFDSLNQDYDAYIGYLRIQASKDFDNEGIPVNYKKWLKENKPEIYNKIR